MKGALQAWRDTLQDLGVMGLVPPPAEVLVAPIQTPTSSVERPLKQARPVGLDRPVSGAYVPPTDLVGCPSQDVVTSSATLWELESRVQGCLACPLGAGRIRFVFGEGNPKASLMFIGEGPGRDEDLQGRPFVGRAGELLDKMIAAICFQRQDVYITNIVKCRPPDNRTPTPAEAQRCLPYVRRQIELVRPKVIVTLGATPLRELLGVPIGITKARGQWRKLDMLGGIQIMPTFHPAYVLRQYTQDVRKAVWEDLKAAKAWIDQHE